METKKEKCGMGGRENKTDVTLNNHLVINILF